MKRCSVWLLLSLCVVLLLLAPVYAQKITGTISGVVTDPSGAVVAGATVAITNTETGLKRTTTTSTAGEYTAPDLPPGTYRVVISQANFKESVTDKVELHVSSSAIVNAQLQVGKSSEQVTVEADTIQVQTDNASLGEVVEGEQVRNLPLNARNFVELTQLVPGVSPANSFNMIGKGLAGGVDFAVNGNSIKDNLFLLDGVNNNDIGSNRTILIYPSLDSIAEFKMVRNSYGPEYGQAGGAVVNIVTKSGTNQFHGSAFYAGRNDKLDTYDFFSAQNAVADRTANVFNPVTNSIYGSPNQDKPILRHNDWGYAFGGPVKKDKLFFFWNQEWNHEIRSVFRQGCVPSAQERAGDFSGGATCGQYLPANINAAVPQSAPNVLSSPMKGMLDYMGNFPLPNQTNCDTTPVGSTAPNGNSASCNNWKANLSSGVFWREENGRADYYLTKNHVAMFKYTQDSWSNPAPVLGYWGDDAYPQLESNWAQPSKSIVGKLTSTIGSHLINDAAFSYSNNRILITPGGTNAGLAQTLTTDFPTLFPENLKSHQFGEPTINLGPNAPGMIAPWNNGENLYNGRDDLSWIHGSHTIKAGVFLGFNAKFEYNGGGSSERLSASTADPNISLAAGTAVPTGDALANAFIAGNQYTSVGEVSTDVLNDVRWRDYEFYVGDSWKVNRKLTVDYGIRYSILTTPYQVNGLMTNFQPQLWSATEAAANPGDACNGLWTVPGKNPCTSASSTFGINFSSGTPGPNKYLKNQNYHQFAPRLGIAYDLRGDGKTAIRAGFGQFYQRDRTAIYTMTSNAPFALTASGIPNGRTLDGPSFTSSYLGTYASTSPDGGIDASSKTPYTLQWNLAVEHSFARETSLQIAYVGNRSVHQLTTSDINEVPQSQWGACSFMSNCNSLRPYYNFGFLPWWGHYGDAHYNSLQALFKARVSRALVNLSYTYSHSIGDVPQDESNGTPNFQTLTTQLNPGLDRGNTEINRPHILIANVVVPLPELRNSNAALRGVAGGWQIATILTAESGPSTTILNSGIGENVALLETGQVTTLNALYGTGNAGPSWAPGSNRRPDITGVSCNSGSHSNYVYNPAAFTVIGHTIGNIGTESTGYCHGPGYVNDDFSLNKAWKVTERVSLQFRLDAFNFFNHPNFNAGTQGGAGSPIGAVNCGAADASGLYQACSVTNNVISAQTAGGDLHSTSILNNAREIQYGLKIVF
jgi:carboxypeptidase family protein